ncbi:MAG: hypothetical protein KJO21_01870 [Verrucomicrobiae bacterium]|nr:hypothetical protein [Verrucomicrobiae bacterium]NNJ42284.1 hypothetical protein [Akkermansiaceae bacterium]
MSRLLILALIGLFALPQARAQHQLIREVYDTKTNTWAQVTLLLGKLPAHGYAPVRIKINNASKTDRDLTLNFTSRDNTAYGNDTGSRMTSRFSCSCAAGSEETYDFLVPLTTIFQTGYGSGSELMLSLTCTGYRASTGSVTTETNDTWPSILLSNELFIPNASSLNSHISPAHSRSGDLEFAGDFDPKSMPTDWRAYIGHDTIMMTSHNWTQLDPGARTAILDWNRLGGHLILYTSHASDDLATLNIDTQQLGKKSATRSLGRVTLTPLPPSKRLDPAKTQKLVQSHNPRTKSLQAELLHHYAKSWPLQITLGEKSFNTTFFILILLAFGILVGPVNLFVFAKAGKRHKLFITTPIISLGASAILIIIIMFQDGFGGRGHRLLLIEVQTDEHKAYIIQEQAARTGVLLGNSFETSEPAMISPVALDPSRWTRVVTNGSAPSSYTANHGSKGLEASGDWFQSRSIHGHILKSVRPTRGGIALTPRAGAPQLTSSFDFDLGTLFYRAKDSTWWKSDTLIKGDATTLTPSSATEFDRWVKTQSDRFTSANAAHINNLSNEPERFFALTENAPGIDTANAIQWLTTTAVITGTVRR